MDAHLLRLLSEGIQFDLQSGYTELGISKIQAALEFNSFCPSLSTAVPGPGGTLIAAYLASALSTSLIADRALQGASW